MRKPAAKRWRTDGARRRAARRDLRKDVRWGVRRGAAVGMLFSGVALLGALLSGSDQFAARTGAQPVDALFLYMVLGPLLGGVVGILRPMTRSTPGTMLIGLVCGVLVALFAGVIFLGLPWGETHMLMLLTSGGCGAVGALLTRYLATGG